ncbi:hypothetical protein NMY22_g8936 [Coprinellus aureogranulatus]|nr:hypothetical protein NMY22_g8936 [Coprinellus aureogranulatus]
MTRTRVRALSSPAFWQAFSSVVEDSDVTTAGNKLELASHDRGMATASPCQMLGPRTTERVLPLTRITNYRHVTCIQLTFATNATQSVLSVGHPLLVSRQLAIDLSSVTNHFVRSTIQRLRSPDEFCSGQTLGEPWRVLCVLQVLGLLAQADAISQYAPGRDRLLFAEPLSLSLSLHRSKPSVLSSSESASGPGDVSGDL